MSSYTKYDQTAIDNCEKLNWDASAIEAAYPDGDNYKFSPEHQAASDRAITEYNEHYAKITARMSPLQIREMEEMWWTD